MARFLYPLILALAACSHPEEAAQGSDSTETAAAQSAFMDWRQGLPPEHTLPFHMEHSMLTVLETTAPGQRGKIILKTTFQSDMISAERLRFRVEGSLGSLGGDITGFLDGPPLQFQGDFLMDGEHCWAQIKTPNSTLLPPSGLTVRFQQHLLEESWALQLAALPLEAAALTEQFD